MLGKTKFEFFKYDKFVILDNESMEIFTTFTKLTSEWYLMTHFSLWFSYCNAIMQDKFEENYYNAIYKLTNYMDEFEAQQHHQI